jgi:NTP pyrophosphatase (non-canonical NTP hydrolase)
MAGDQRLRYLDGQPLQRTGTQAMSTATDSWQAMLAAVQAFHDKHRFRDTGGEELTYRVALMAEELGEISSCVTKGKSKDSLTEEVADLLILIMGTGIAADFDLNAAFWAKMEKLMQRESRMVGGRIRVSEFRDMD